MRGDGNGREGVKEKVVGSKKEDEKKEKIEM